MYQKKRVRLIFVINAAIYILFLPPIRNVDAAYVYLKYLVTVKGCPSLALLHFVMAELLKLRNILSTMTRDDLLLVWAQKQILILRSEVNIKFGYPTGSV